MISQSDSTPNGNPRGDGFYADPSLPKSPRSILVVGGSFDPPHVGHVKLARDAARAHSIQHVVFVPANTSPFKMREGNHASPAQRLHMMRLGIAHESNMSVSSFEVDRDPPSYTVHTLEALRTTIGDAPEVRLFLGADQALTFDRWFEAERMLELATPLVVLRPPFNTWNDLAQAGLDESWRDRVIALPLHQANSTEIRRRISNGESPPTDWLAKEVLDYIRAQGLYRRDSEPEHHQST